MEIHNVIYTIRQLANKTVSRGCTEAEALQAAIKVGELLKVYNLSMDKVFLGDAKCITGQVDTGRNNRHPVDYCLISISEFCDCYVWRHRDWEGGKKTSAKYFFFGLEADVEMAKYLYANIFQAIETETQRFKRSDAYCFTTHHRRLLSVSFQKGMAGRISKRLQEMMQGRQQEEAVGQNSLVVVKRGKVKDEFESLSLGLKQAPSNHRPIATGAYAAGKVAANKVNFNRPIQGKVSGYLK